MELEKAQKARSQGLEGKARVCARRAAGWAAQHYLSQQKASQPNQNALAALQELAISHPQRNIRSWAQHLTKRVDESYQLPKEIDLLEEASQLINALEGSNTHE